MTQLTPTPDVNAQTWRTYSAGTMATWNHSPVVAPHRLELLNAALGVAGETGEILLDVQANLDPASPDFLANLKGEIGDVLYYLTRVAEHFHQNDGTEPFDVLITNAIMTATSLTATAGKDLDINFLVVGLATEGSRIAEYAKKLVFHSKTIAADDLNDVMFAVAHDLEVLAAMTGTTLVEIGNANLAKLAARYPQGFTAGGGIR